jgi:uncharacterized RDD family membrane protein YckC
MDLVLVGIPVTFAAVFIIVVLAPISGTAALFAAFALPLWFLLLPCYHALMEAGKRGQTLGKRAVRIAVRRAETFERVGYRRSFTRAIAFLLIWVGPPLLPTLPSAAHLLSWPLGWLPLLDALWPLWDERKQALHDKVAGTVVVRT